MSIQKSLLHSVQAIEEQYTAGDYIFREEAIPQFYYQIVTGEVKLNSYKEDGKEFIQEILSDNSCFGESMLILGKPYTVNAVALTKCSVLKIGRDQFFRLLQDNPAIFLDMYTTLSERTSEKLVLMQKISGQNAEERLVELMNQMKEAKENKDKYSFEIPYTRQQLASLTGLSLETTIRVIKRMEKNENLVIKNGKIFY
ncbi:Crp/Fnr family transcriptional regulator [Chryseobacterium sp. WG14]|uniref:Crp/Fnr family transcriptional regulator n=1 Tax=unclassified Chryseobacterium TaxID=2593645 RepID=UPI00211F0DD7|nr:MULTISPECIES: Crp/Fnr family transcriptional regulator [unclassified Chryseobacterium]MCQ9634276.1 Crp/Fnr family transcriptional regulator [Chryseobacterium sp. WG23]MCQ9638058.1 Crp/Fnr family transcriptional regulator [Chryseobacterium sp. WG14]